MPAITIDTMMPGNESTAASVVTRAMVTNPNHIAIWKGQGERQLASQTALTRLIFQKTPTENMLLATADEQVVGVLRMARSPACQMSPAQSLALLPRLVAIQRSNTGRTLNWLSTWAKHDPKEVHWHLGPVGVLPERQGQRIGTQLMERYLGRVDADAIGAYLETDKIENVGYYEQFGFNTTGTDEVSGVTNWFMWRPPQ
jgi:predicted N-acetyltransferase YhbS